MKMKRSMGKSAKEAQESSHLDKKKVGKGNLCDSNQRKKMWGGMRKWKKKQNKILKKNTQKKKEISKWLTLKTNQSRVYSWLAEAPKRMSVNC